jgi:hypothetical protein
MQEIGHPTVLTLPSEIRKRILRHSGLRPWGRPVGPSVPRRSGPDLLHQSCYLSLALDGRPRLDYLVLEYAGSFDCIPRLLLVGTLFGGHDGRR